MSPMLRRRSRTDGRSPGLRRLIRYGWLLPVGVFVIAGSILVVTYAFASIPLPKDIHPDASAEVFDRNGHLIGTYSNAERRFLIDTTKLPHYVAEGVIASEDRNYFNHGGIDLKGIIRAAWADLTHGQVQQGGSTIAQQYVKNAILQDPERTLLRKIKEAILAIKLEHRYSKEQILGFYLNTIYFGRGAYGIEAAARTYFNEHASKLSLTQAAFLAGIIPAPESYQPDDNPKGARIRRDHVLELMVQQGYISRARADKAEHGPIKAAKASSELARHQEAAYFMEWLRKDFLYPEYGSCLYTCGLKIYTTLDLTMQHAAEDAVSSTLPEKTDPQAALVSMTPTGEVRAFVGGRYFDSVKAARGFDYASDYPGRQAGSAFKPFTLLTAIEQGISTQSRFSGRSPVTITDPACSPPYVVNNFAGEQYGTITLDEATTNSVNTVFAQLIAQLGPDKVAATIAKFGFDRKGTAAEREVTPYCSLALGSLDVTPMEMARAYSGFDAQGKLPPVTPIAYIKNSDGDCVKAFVSVKFDCKDEVKPSISQAADANSTEVLSQTLTHVVQGGTATAANIGRPVAGKTGTTQNHQNAWFAGYIPQLTTVVWMGYPIEAGADKKMGTGDDFIPQMQYCSDTSLCRPVHGQTVVGGLFPAQIWAKYMSTVAATMPIVPFPLPTSQPTKVINSVAPPVAPSQSPHPGKTVTPGPTIAPPPSPHPTPSQTPAPASSPPNVIPTPTAKRRKGEP
ncbi:MAG: hypothetical protein QOC87_857 [Actinomycetota bacterium]|nr:hypothetical protein [Actinomycetota bacterium]